MAFVLNFLGRRQIPLQDVSLDTPTRQSGRGALAVGQHENSPEWRHPVRPDQGV